MCVLWNRASYCPVSSAGRAGAMIGRRTAKKSKTDGRWRLKLIVFRDFVDIEGLGWQNVALDILERRWSNSRRRWIYRVPAWHWRAGDCEHG